MTVKAHLKGTLNYRRRAPAKILDLISGIPQKGVGTLRGKNVVLVHPSLGKCSNNLIYALHSNQLDWIANEWARLCDMQQTAFGDAMEVGALFLDGREGGSFRISREGKITKIK